MDLNFGAIHTDQITLYRVTDENAGSIRQLLRPMPDIAYVLGEFENSYLPRFDAGGRQIRFGFLATLNGVPAGFSMLAVESWETRVGYTGADALPHMRGRGVTPGSKPHLFYLAFELLGLGRVYTACALSNTASRRSLEKTPGLRFEGVVPGSEPNEQGEIEDEYQYGLMKSEWEAIYDKNQVTLLPDPLPFLNTLE